MYFTAWQRIADFIFFIFMTLKVSNCRHRVEMYIQNVLVWFEVHFKSIPYTVTGQYNIYLIALYWLTN